MTYHYVQLDTNRAEKYVKKYAPSSDRNFIACRDALALVEVIRENAETFKDGDKNSDQRIDCQELVILHNEIYPPSMAMTPNVAQRIIATSSQVLGSFFCILFTIYIFLVRNLSHPAWIHWCGSPVGWDHWKLPEFEA